MHDVISAFLDNEPFDAKELSEALTTQEGRELLIDLIALRSVIQPTEHEGMTQVGRRPLWMLVSAAAVLLALVSGYQIGRSTGADAMPAPGGAVALVAPEPTTLLKFEPGVNWAESPRNGGN